MKDKKNIVVISPMQEENGIKLVWRRNKEGNQKIGNKQILIKPNFEQFRKEILPRTKSGHYKGVIPVEKFADFESRNKLTNNPVVIVLIDKGNGWEVTKIDTVNDIYQSLIRPKEKNWCKEVDNFKSKDAINFRKAADSELNTRRKKMPVNVIEKRKKKGGTKVPVFKKNTG